MDKQRARKRLKDHADMLKYQLTAEQENEIVSLYELNNEDYIDDAFSLCVEEYISGQPDYKNLMWEEHRRPSVFAKRVGPQVVGVPSYKKTPELTGFLVSQLGVAVPFCLLSKGQMHSLVSTMLPLDVEAGVVLIHEGGVGTEMYIIEEGEFEVAVGNNLVNRLYSGAIFGELALLHGIPRTATVRAVKKSRVWSAEQTSFTCIRVQDQLYKKNLAKEVILSDPLFKERPWDPEHIEETLSAVECMFVPANNPLDLNDGEVAIILRPAKIKDTEIRSVQPKDLVRTSFYCITNLECYIIKVKNTTN